ncbi:MAG: heavy-metal-associated domain-containing protein [Candidatus Berkelbacteria bacterium]|nr:MAG: heavy-metal-associated domain-containing protein [Candidatus Berkelbacteria bacterium]QQG51955.1 MAG: heavy-metal-associated domain-containing protein [Candidatus Berkelbacteria bacterium]
MTKQRFYIPDVHCASCVMLLETLEEDYDAINSVEVNLGKKSAEIVFDENKLGVEDVIKAIEETSGYKAEVSHD